MESNYLTTIPKPLAQEVRKIGEIEDAAELRNMLIRTLALTIENVCRFAAIISRLRELGEDLSDLGIGGVSIYLRIADGQILPALMVRLVHHERLLMVAANMPLKDQEKIANNEPLDVHDLRGPDYRRVVPPLSMTARERKQVFSRDHIRDESEQLAILRERELRQRSRPTPESPEIVTDQKRGCVWFGSRALTRKDLLRLLEDLEPARPRKRAPIAR